MSDLKFKTKDGYCTAYALACGYIDCSKRNGQDVHMYHDGVYHVRGWDSEKHKRLFWDSFDTLTEARKAYKAKVRKLFRGEL